jgi:hypothetical protein
VVAMQTFCVAFGLNPLNTQLNPICHLLALLGAHPILHVSRIRVKTVAAGQLELCGSASCLNARVVY